MKRETIRWIQHELNSRGFDAGTEDGLVGPQTYSALENAKITPPEWPKERQLIGFVQAVAEEKGIDAGPLDGYWGPQTQKAFEQLQSKNDTPEIIEPDPIVPKSPIRWPGEESQSELIRFYGQPGENQASLALPYPHRLSWELDRTINRFTCHEKVHDSLGRVLTRVLDHYGPDEISRLNLDIWGGCLNVRKKRGGDDYSTHSWGIAVDYDPERNQLKWGRDRASFAKPEYEMWWKIWEEEGWVSLGRAKNYDWMHVQACGA